MRVTRLGPSIPLVTLGGFGGQTTGTGGTVWTSNGSNGAYWAENVARITANGSNTVLGPFVNLASGSNTTFSVASNTLTINAAASGSPTGDAGGDLGGSYPNPSVLDDSHNHTISSLPSSVRGEILVLDTPAGSPLVFADLLQNEAGTDLLYADI